MRVLILTQYFAPEVTAATQRLHPFAAGLAARGHQVEVICEVPSHPRGVVETSYGGRLAETRELDGFRTTYVWTHASPSKRARHRLASYVSYAAIAAAVAAARRRPDAIVASSPPLSVGAVGALAAARHRTAWLLDVRDLWPEVAVALGEVRNPRLIAAAERLERRLYRSAGAITTPTEPFREHIAARAPDSRKVHVIPNGTTGAWLEAGEAEPQRAALGLPADRFVWTYAGNVGLSQDLDTALEAARLLGDGYQLTVVGDGASLPRLRETARALGEGAVRFVGLVEPPVAARYMRASDVLLLPLAANPELGKSVPIKLYDYCAIGRPLLVAASGEVRRIAERERLALTADPGEPAKLAAALRRLAADQPLRERLATAARRFAGEHRREAEVERLEKLLVSIR